MWRALGYNVSADDAVIAVGMFIYHGMRMFIYPVS